MAIGERLKEERVRLKLSQTELGAVGGVGKTTQINYEKGVGSPDGKYLAAVAEKGVDVLYVLTGNRTPKPAEGLSVAEEKILDNYRALPEEDQASVRRLTTALAQSIGPQTLQKKSS
ncbi:helix-turn-helix domain-containing protein [Pseudomonas stutzeri]|uniref:helix-turn-helix domain-containing protein n=1 Tax=Stutzerimonas stutzeri TaxID=316 RepID=UPI0018D9F0AD|nr:helix-turn-helix domain-containing protein [Stutzerimonas stutzeri]MBH3356282.1 helix-turn-helix domain-containing protein [Stutzerimonas stutzeri]